MGGIAEMRLMKKCLATVPAVLLFASCIREGRPGGEIAPGDRLPDFVVEMNDGSLVSTASLEGSVSLVMFFNTGCPDCREELPAVQRIYDEFGSCVRIVCISREEGRAGIEAYWRENGLTLPYSAQEDREVYELFAGSGVPRVYVSSPDLVVRKVYDDDPIAGYDELAADIRGLLPSGGLQIE